MQKSFIFSGLCVLATLGIQLGCAKQVTTPKGMPEWTLIKSGLNTVDGNRALYAVGIGKSRIVQAARDESCGYARVEIGKYVQTEVNALIEASYKSSSDGADSENAGKTVKSGFKNAVDQKLSGVGCVKMWRDPSEGSTYALARFDAGAMTGILKDVLEAQKNANNLSAELEKKNDILHEEMMNKIEKKFGKASE